jgi:hypothetical protein
MIEERLEEQNCLFRRGDYRNYGYKSNTVLSSSLGEDVGFGDNKTFFYDIHRYVSNDQAYGKLSGNKD